MPKPSKKELLKILPSQIGKMTRGQLQPLVRQARALLKNQEKIFKKYESSVYSPALEKIQDYYGMKGDRKIRSMTRGELQNELVRLQDFFESETSTVPGARRVQVEQDRRIFGVKTESGISYTEKSGRPVNRMSVEQRRSFWAAYMEYTSLKGEAYTRNLSDVIQQFLGEMVMDQFGDGPLDLEYEDMMAFFRELEMRIAQRKDEEEWELSNYAYRDSDVSSGKRPY